jgi:hypothetical protein
MTAASITARAAGARAAVRPPILDLCLLHKSCEASGLRISVPATFRLSVRVLKATSSQSRTLRPQPSG